MRRIYTSKYTPSSGRCPGKVQGRVCVERARERERERDVVVEFRDKICVKDLFTLKTFLAAPTS